MGAQSDTVALWTASEVGKWLESIGCGELKDAALQNNVNGVQLQTLSANNMLNIIGASGLQASKIRSELAKAEITQNQAISAAQPIIHPSPFSSAQPTPPLPTSTAPYTGGMPPSAVTCGAYPAPGVYPAPIPGYVQPVNIIYQPALAPNAHHSITTKFSMALVILFTFLFIFATVDVGIRGYYGVAFADYAAAIWVGDVLSMVAAIIFIPVQVTVGRRGSLSTTRSISITVLVVAIVVGIISFAGVCRWTRELSDYDMLGSLTTDEQASLAMGWLIVAFWVGIIIASGLEIYYLFHRRYSAY